MRGRRFWLPAITALLLIGSASAWEVRVEDEAGPADLGARVDAAVDAWRAAGADVDGVDRTVLVRYGDSELLGPDALSLVVTGGPPGVDFEVVVRADANEQLDDALVVAIGIALGGTPGVGVLDPRLAAGEPRLPSPDDAAALAPGVGLPGDVTGDGSVGFDDLLELAASWGRQGINLPADLDGDGSVGDGDLDILRDHYRFAPVGGDAERMDPEAGGADSGAEHADPELAPEIDDPLDAVQPDQSLDGERQDEPKDGSGNAR